MLISIIIPAFNCETTLKTTLGSILCSGLTDFEVLLIDDGSTDGTAALCELLCQEHDVVRCIHQKNTGVSAARNCGIAAAQGDYIWFVDADDTVDAGAMAAVAALTCETQPDLLMFGMRFDYYHKKRLYRSEALIPPHDGLLPPEQLKKAFRSFYDCNALTSVCNKLYRRTLLLEHGIRFHAQLHLMEDFLFVLDVLPHCRSIYCLPQPIYRYRQSEDERGAYRRLQRIADLAQYIQPFEERLHALDIDEADALLDAFYTMLLRQKMQYAALAEIRKTIQTHQSGSRAGMPLRLSPLGVYLSNRKTLLRHRIAVAVKSTAAYQKRKAVDA